MEGRINSALISIYHKEGLAPLLESLNKLDITLYSTGGTRDFIEEQGYDCVPVEEVTGYPSILGGRVKTLHPKIFGGILARRNNKDDLAQLAEYEIPPFDLVIVDLYPFAETVQSGASEADIIEKIDVGGVALIRAAAKNFNQVLVIPSTEHYSLLETVLKQQAGISTAAQRKQMMIKSFEITSHYDQQIRNYFSGSPVYPLRYGENPHQKGVFHGNLSDVLHQHNGKELSYNNLLDIEAAILLISDFPEKGFAVIKHNNACGASMDNDALSSWKKALAGDPVSAFGGVIITSHHVTDHLAREMSTLFFEVLIAGSYDDEALKILKEKKNRIILQLNKSVQSAVQYRSVLGGMLEQSRDLKVETADELKAVTEKKPDDHQLADLLFANIIAKHSKSNAIALVANKQLIGNGAGQTSRIDALKHAIEKAQGFGFSLKNAVLASDAFFPFDDCVKIAAGAGIPAIVQPGGSVRDADSVAACNQAGIAMVFTGFRHFKH